MKPKPPIAPSQQYLLNEIEDIKDKKKDKRYVNNPKKKKQ